MADILLNKVINQEISSASLIKWLLMVSPLDNEHFNEISACRVSQIDFATFFLNYIHKVLSASVSIGASQKFSSLKRTEKRQINKNFELDKSFKSNLSAPGASQKITPEAPTIPSKDSISNTEVNITSISPLCEQSSHRPLSNEQNFVEKKSDKHSVCLGDFLTSPKNPIKKKKKSLPPTPKPEVSKRIRPTTISSRQSNSDFGSNQNSFNFQQSSGSTSDLTEDYISSNERSLISGAKLTIPSNVHYSGDISSGTRSVGFLTPLTKPENLGNNYPLKPLLQSVTYRETLSQMVDIYNTIVKSKLILNITSEVHFLVCLVVTKHVNYFEHISEKKTNENRIENNHQCPPHTSLETATFFKSMHNVTFFAVKALEAQASEISIYDKTTISLLAECNNLKEFSPDLNIKLLKCALDKLEKPTLELPFSDSETVCFNIDTDNKENFPDLVSFQAFRKQRDLFYDILTIWEKQHLTPDWNFALGLAGKIRSLLNLHSGCANLMHLARLFKNQLLSSCAKGPKEKGLSDDSYLPSLPIDADKLRILTNRLITKETINGINTVPTFSGYQEFFKEFMVISSNYGFTVNLRDCFIATIIELNDRKFYVDEIDERIAGDELDTRRMYINCINELRILAKFLGFLESLPFKSDPPITNGNVIEYQIDIRKKILPALDVNSLLRSALENNTLIYLIPWLTKYLAMLDHITLRLPYYTSLFTILFDLYQNVESADCIPPYNASVIRLSLGWLFDLPNFPNMEYFNYCSKRLNGSIEAKTFSAVQGSLKARRLDFTPIVDQSVLYLCCPYLDEIKRVLCTNASYGTAAVKYITPITATETSSDMVKKKVEQQLEDAFFSCQPASLRRTLEFICERVASAAVKQICYYSVPVVKKAALSDLKEIILKVDNMNQYSDEKERETALKKQGAVLAQTHLVTFLSVCEIEMQKIACDKMPMAIEGLLPVDTFDETLDVCGTIAYKMYTGRVKRWITNHVNITLFTKDFDAEIHKEVMNRRGEKNKPAFALPPGGRECDHDEQVFSGFNILNKIREACCKASTVSADITVDFVLRLLQDAYSSLTQRNDVNDLMICVVATTAFDFYLLIVANYQEVLSQSYADIEGLLLNIWTIPPALNTSFRMLFCPKNVKILQSSPNKKLAWDLYAKLVTYLLNKHLIDLEELESQCTGLYQKTWEPEILECFSHFLQKLLTYSGSEGKENFAALIEFLADFCRDL
ncbi:codanin-1 [Euwallacea fornicatus]|uniref:codanin-1 n=1 Tax=Euwallacea fornicatus TaxID=995702 RepID=UPI00338F00AB